MNRLVAVVHTEDRRTSGKSAAGSTSLRLGLSKVSNSFRAGKVNRIEVLPRCEREPVENRFYRSSRRQNGALIRLVQYTTAHNADAQTARTRAAREESEGREK